MVMPMVFCIAMTGHAMSAYSSINVISFIDELLYTTRAAVIRYTTTVITYYN